MFGVADACMVGAAMVGALLAPAVAAAFTPQLLLLALVGVAGAGAAIIRRDPAQQRPVTAVPAMSSSMSTDVESPAEASSPAVRSA